MAGEYIDGTGLRQRFGTDELDGLIGADATAVPPEAGDTDKLARACEDATNLINGYLGSRYTLPLSSVPDMVKAWAADIARYRLWDERAPEEVRRRYDDCLDQLRLVANGTIALPPGSDGNKPDAGGVAFGGYSACRVFTSDTLAGY